MPFVILPTNSASGGYDITNSLRFNSGSDDALTKTFSSGNRKTFTISLWHKRSNLGGLQLFLATNSSNTDATALEFGIFSDSIVVSRWSFYNLNTTTALFRDVSAWYHIVLSVDTTQATDTNRMRLYVNGSEVTSFSATSYPTLNEDLPINLAQAHYIGKTVYGASNDRLLNGYLSDYYFIDGQQLTPSSFGETDTDTGIWKPKAFSGTYGTNGFYLQFKNSASLGTDSSGNGNNFTVNNLTSIDQTTDTPTNNFATFNPLDKNTSITTSEGNLKITGTNDCKTTIGVSKGKWFCETKVTAIGTTVLTGITFSSVDGSNHSAVDAKRIVYQESGFIYREATGNGSVNTGTTYTTSDIIGLALDCDNGTMKFYKNGTLIHTETDSVISGNEQMFYSYMQSATVEMNFGNPSYTAGSYTDGAGYGNFSYAVPSGYYALNTKNLATFG